MDHFRKSKSLYSATANSFGVGEGVTITPSSVVDLPTDTEIVLTFDRQVEGKLERILGSIVGSNFVVSSGGRGYDGTTEQSHTSPTVEVVPSGADIDDLVEGILAEHNQDGSHKINKLDALRYAADAGSTDAYAITLSPAPTAYYAGMEIIFKANTANTGGATIDINGLGAKSIKKLHDQDLETGDIEANQLIVLVYDGTSFQMTSQIAQVSTQVVTDAGSYVRPVTAGDALRSYDAGDDDYAEIKHNETDVIVTTNKGHIVLTPAANKLVKISVLEQLNTTNGYLNNAVILTGYSRVTTPAGATYYREGAVTFGVTFASAPIVIVSATGGRGATPTQATGFTENYEAGGGAVTTTGFVPWVAKGTTAVNLQNSTNYVVAWIAIGVLT